MWPHEPGDAAAFWELEHGLEPSLDAGTGDDDKLSAYEAKLTDDYHERYFPWVERCATDNPGCVIVAEAVSDDGQSGKSGDATLVGYVFAPPEEMAFTWDAAAPNELFLDADYRGSGAADELMDAVLAHARSQDLPLDRVALDVDEVNGRIRAFYKRYGFDHQGELTVRDL